MTSVFRRGVDRAMRWLGSRFRPGAAILMYHRICDPGLDPFGISVSPERFAEHLEVVRQIGTPVDLLELARGLEAGRLPPRAVAVTFDDGYADNLHQARPVLEKYDVPATLFVTSGLIGGDGSPWWDELASLLLGEGSLPPRLELRVDGRKRSWPVDGGARRRIFKQLYRLLRPWSDEERRPIMESLRGWSGRPVEKPHPMLSHDELRRLADGNLVRIGCHTATHRVLSRLDEEEQRREIESCRSALRETTGSEVSSFAYPFGKVGDYDSTTLEIVRGSGFACACTARQGVAVGGGDPFQLPRLRAIEDDGDGFARMLRLWFPLVGRRSSG